MIPIPLALAAFAATTSVGVGPRCGLPSSVCFRNSKQIHQFPSDSAAACCAACQQNITTCVAWQLETSSSPKHQNPKQACLLMSKAQSNPGSNATCISGLLPPAVPPERLNRTSFSGVWIQHGNDADLYSKGFVVGADKVVNWADVQTAEDTWDWNATDQLWAAAATAGYYIETAFTVYTAGDAPPWLYKHVPQVKVMPKTKSKNPETFTAPYFLDPAYAPIFLNALKMFAAHIGGLPKFIRDRIVVTQGMFGSEGDDTPWHGYNKIENKTVYNAFSLSVHKMWISIFGTTSAERAIPLLFNGLGSASLPGLQEAVNASVRAGMMPRGYMIKVGGPSHLYSESGEMETYNTIAPLMRTPLSPGVYVRSRGESTLSASTSWMTNAGWTAWALSGFSLAYGADTWQNNTLIEEQPRLWPALATFSRYAGWRPETAHASPGAIAILRDGLDTSDTARFPESEFGPVAKGKNYTRCQNVLDSLQQATRFPPRNDIESHNACGCNRKVPGLGLNDACFEVWPGNYGALLEQIDPVGTSVGAWRAGPTDEIFGRYGRSAGSGNKTNNYHNSNVGDGKGELAFRAVHGVFGAADKGKPAFARVVFLADTGDAGKFELKYSRDDGTCASAGSVSGAGSNASNTGHWVEAHFALPSADLDGTSAAACLAEGGASASVVVAELGRDRAKPTIFSTVELSKTFWDFQLSPWTTEADV